MKTLKSVEIFSDVICENCVSFNEGLCRKELPDIPVGKDNKCSEGDWLFKGDVINFRQICLELAPVGFVNDVDDLECKNCIYYHPSRNECHFHRQNVYKSAADDWCDNGMWLYRENDEEATLVSLSFFYPNN